MENINKENLHYNEFMNFLQSGEYVKKKFQFGEINEKELKYKNKYIKKFCEGMINENYIESLHKIDEMKEYKEFIKTNEVVELKRLIETKGINEVFKFHFDKIEGIFKLKIFREAVEKFMQENNVFIKLKEEDYDKNLEFMKSKEFLELMNE